MEMEMEGMATRVWMEGSYWREDDGDGGGGLCKSRYRLWLSRSTIAPSNHLLVVAPPSKQKRQLLLAHVYLI